MALLCEAGQEAAAAAAAAAVPAAVAAAAVAAAVSAAAAVAASAAAAAAAARIRPRDAGDTPGAVSLVLCPTSDASVAEAAASSRLETWEVMLAEMHLPVGAVRVRAGKAQPTQLDCGQHPVGAGPYHWA